jgi:hypothetical protein
LIAETVFFPSNYVLVRTSHERGADRGRTVPIAQVFFGHDIGTGVVYQDANIKVTAVESSHLELGVMEVEDRSVERGKHEALR